jgi:hypothetical protein
MPSAAIDRVRERAAGEPVAVDVLTTAEVDRRLEVPPVSRSSGREALLRVEHSGSPPPAWMHPITSAAARVTDWLPAVGTRVAADHLAHRQARGRALPNSRSRHPTHPCSSISRRGGRLVHSGLTPGLGQHGLLHQPARRMPAVAVGIITLDRL